MIHVASIPSDIHALCETVIAGKLYHAKSFDIHRVCRLALDGEKKMYGLDFSIIRLAVAIDNTGKKPAPMGSALVWGYTAPGHTMWKYIGVYVKPKYRGQGVGRRLAEITSAGFPMVMADDVGADGNAHKFYKKLGPKFNIEK